LENDAIDEEWRNVKHPLHAALIRSAL
jgi:hypothetical protein